MQQKFSVLSLVVGLTLVVGNATQAALVAHWKFDDVAGDVAISEINSPEDDGKLEGNCDFRSQGTDLPPIDGNVSVLESNGTPGNQVSTAYPGITGTKARTVTAWIKTRDSGTRKDCFAIVSWGPPDDFSRFGIRLDGGMVRIEHGNGRRIGTRFVATGKWVHIAVSSADGNNDLQDVKIYVNGVLDTVDSETGGEQVGFSTVAGSFEIGGLGVYQSGYGSGMIDDVRVYDTELSAGEIAELAHARGLGSTLLGVAGIALLITTGVVLYRRNIR